MKDLFGSTVVSEPVRINIYADEIQGKECPMTKHEWHYIGLIFEDLSQNLKADIISERYCGNFDPASEYYPKNNQIAHWSTMDSANSKNVCKRWFEYILDPSKSGRSFYSYILGLNNSNLIAEDFDTNDEFNSKYNRFFRSAILYAVKVFFSGKQVVIENIFHEHGQQQNSQIFPWHSIYKLRQNTEIKVNCSEIQFLPKDHKIDDRSNLVQLCDCILGVSTALLHGIEESKRSAHREELAEMYLPLFSRLLNSPNNPNSQYQYAKRMMIRFFPRTKSAADDGIRANQQFYSKRPLLQADKMSGQGALFTGISQ